MIRHAIVLAGGKGKRLRPITDELPKALVEVGGSTLIGRGLVALAGAGIEMATVVVGYRAQDIVAALAKDPPVPVAFVHQEEQLGSGHAVGLCHEAAGDEPFLLIWSDIITDRADYQTIGKAWVEGDAAVIGVIESDDVAAGGAVVFDESGSVTLVVEKPSQPPPSRWNNAGILSLGPQIWPYLRRLEPSARGELEFTEGLAAMVADGLAVRAVGLRGPWFDVGTPQSLAAARASWR